MKINGGYNSLMLTSLYNSSKTLFGGGLGSLFSVEKNNTTAKDYGDFTAGYTESLKLSSSRLSGAMKDLSNISTWAKKGAVSSDESVLTADFKNVSKFGGGAKSVSVKVKQIASGQTNEGHVLDAGEKFGSEGTNTFAVEIGGKTTELSIEAKTGDTNADFQKKMADAINSAGIGLKASVVQDSEKNTSMLKIESEGVGSDAKNKFSIKDVSGDAVAKTGADTISKEAQNAVYSVNGGFDRVSKSNDVDLGNGIKATLKSASDKDATISLKIDKKAATDKVKEMVYSYNDLYSTALGSAADDPKASKLFSKILGNSKTYAGSLAAIGIGFDVNGKMTIDSDALDKAAESGKLESFFTKNKNSNYGFNYNIAKIANDVQTNTSKYSSNGNAASLNSFSFSNFNNYSQYLAPGSLLDYFL